ncbi:cytochrome c oxidase assembly protein [Sulfitobacter sp. HI0021]|nr:cytochrome c oxidase assembly protein [Sulfitobacter sp. HI0021]
MADQQLGGILMWVPASLPYAVVAGAVAQRGWAALRAGNA